MANYFSHDSNARNDEKLIRLRMRHKAAGYGVYFMILERLREEKNYMSAKDYNMIAFDLREDASLIKSVVEDFGLFEFTDIDGKKFFYSESFLDRMSHKDELSRKRSEAGKASAAKRQQVLNICSEENQQVLNKCDDVIKEPKEIKEIKEKQSKENSAYARDDEFLDKFFKTNIGQMETLLMNLGLKPDEQMKLRKIAEEVVNEWKVCEAFHATYADWSRHLISTIRIKLKVDASTKQSLNVNGRQDENARIAREEREKKVEELMRQRDQWTKQSVSLEEARNSEEYKRAMAEA